MRYYVGASITRQITVEEVEPEQDPGPDFIAATDLVFKWQIGWSGIPHTEMPEEISEGRYQATYVPTESGTIHWRWEGTVNGVFRIVKEGHDIVLASAFEAGRVRDYAG